MRVQIYTGSMGLVAKSGVGQAILHQRKMLRDVYYGHSTEEDFKRSFIGSTFLAPLFRRWITFCYNLGDIVITPTEYSKTLLERYGVRRPVYSLTNGIDTSFFRPSAEAGKRFRKKYRISENQKVVLSV